MISKIYFEYSGATEGPFELDDVIDRLSSEKCSFNDSAYSEGIAKLWTPLSELFLCIFPDKHKSNVYLWAGRGKALGPFDLNQCFEKANFNKGFWNNYRVFNQETKAWQPFKDFLLHFLLPNAQEIDEVIDLEEINESEEVEEEGDVDVSSDTNNRNLEDNLEDAPAEIRILDKMIAESSEFKELSASLGGFNLWDFFHINTLELQNERMLLWLLKENKSHNLGDFFLRRWLILVLHNDRLKEKTIQRSLNPLNIEYARVVESKIISQKKIFVNGRKRRLDLFIDLKTLRQDDWVIIIEIKVAAAATDNQLKDYRQWLNENYPKHKKLTIFLYDDNEEHELPPNEDLYWLKTTFSDIRKVIKDALIEKKGLIPLRERSFIEQYLENLPPLAPEGKLENLTELTHKLFGNYSKGIRYANDAFKKEGNLDSWENHAKCFVQERKKEFSLLEKQDEYSFLRCELACILNSKKWFPQALDVKDVITFNQNDLGIDLVDMMKKNHSEWQESVSSRHLCIYFHLFYGTYRGNSRFRLRLRIPPQNGFIDQRNLLIEDFFEQIPSNYGGNDMPNRNSGLIYNRVLDYEISDNLFTLSQNIIEGFKKIWVEDEYFSMGIRAILEQIRD